MRIIKELARQIEEEVEGVTDYAKAAVEYKPTRPQLAEDYYRIANAEYGHVKTLHDHVAKLAKEAEDMGRVVPPEMRDKYDEAHKRIIAKMAEAKTYLELYK